MHSQDMAARVCCRLMLSSPSTKAHRFLTYIYIQDYTDYTVPAAELCTLAVFAKLMEYRSDKEILACKQVESLTCLQVQDEKAVLFSSCHQVPSLFTYSRLKTNVEFWILLQERTISGVWRGVWSAFYHLVLQICPVGRSFTCKVLADCILSLLSEIKCIHMLLDSHSIWAFWPFARITGV